MTQLPGPLVSLFYLGRRPVVQGRRIDAKALALGQLFNAVRTPGVTPTLAESRRSLSVLAAKFDQTAPASIAKRDLQIPGAAGARPARLYDAAPLDAQDRPVLLFLHGGGWVQGDLETHDGLCAQIAAESGLRVIALDYRLAPEHPFPAGLDDAAAAYHALRAEPARYGIDPDRLFVGGDSAGGNLTAALIHDLQEASAPLPCGQVLIYPAVDGRMQSPSMQALPEAFVLPVERMAWYLAQYAGGAETLQPRISPLFSPHLAGQPPALIIAAGHDPLWDDGLAYAEALRQAGVPVELLRYDGQIHAFLSMRRALPQGRDALSKLSHWLRDKAG